MPVYKPTSMDVENSIWSSAKGYQSFQAWHDRRHLIYHQNFTLAGEHYLAQQHLDELLREGVDMRDAVAVYNLVYGRNRYFHNNGKRVACNAARFVRDAFNKGVETAARAEEGDSYICV